MTEWPDSVWWAVLALGVVGSALYSGLETGIYRINRVRLQILEHRRRRSARTLWWLVQRPTTMLSTLLIGNNVTNYMGTAALVVILERWGYAHWQVIAINVAVITPLLLVFGEILPKDLFSAHSDRLTYRFAWLLDVSRHVFRVCGLLVLIEGFSGLLARLLGVPSRGAGFHPRRQVELLVKEGVGHGLLSDEQSAIVERVLELSSRNVGQEMVAWEDVQKVEAGAGPGVMWELGNRTSHTRFPVVEGERVVGVVSVYDALRHGQEGCPPIRDLMTPALTLDIKTPLRSGLTTLQSRHAALAVVTEGDRPVGVVTVKDLVEPITGELLSW